MCGRFALYSSPARIKTHFVTVNELDVKPRFNIAPTQIVPVVRADESGKRELATARWGLIPSWADDPDEIPHPINAKTETAAINPMFRHAFRSSRILIPADAFYEWSPRDGKQPFLFKLRDGEPMGLGGLLECWHGYETEIMTFTILTTPSNPLMTDIHERMPVIINPENYTAWLDGKLTDVIKIQEMTQPYPERLMEVFPISRNVNNPINDTPELIIPLREADKTGTQPVTISTRKNHSMKSPRIEISR